MNADLPIMLKTPHGNHPVSIEKLTLERSPFKGILWSGRRESNPRRKLGKLPFYH